jgi:hypothetical protein
MRHIPQILGLLLAGSLQAQGLLPLCDYDAQGAPLCREIGADPIDEGLLVRLSEALPEQQNVNHHHPEFLDNVQVNLVLSDSADVWLTFVNEGASYRNSLGYYTYDPAAPPQDAGEVEIRWLLLPNASREGSGGALLPGDRVYLGAFGPGTGIGWFLIANGWVNGAVNPDRPTWFGERTLNPAGVPMAIQLRDLESDRLFICFEDIRADTGGDRDYNDLICAATVSPPEAVDWEGVEILPDEELVHARAPERPVDCRINGVYPNPFNPTATIRWTLRETGFVRLSVHNLAGREVAVLRQGLAAAGTHETPFDAKTLPSGVYFSQLEALGQLSAHKLVLLR